MKGRPIKPAEVAAFKSASIPPEVFDAFNELIAESWTGSRAVVMQSQAVKRVQSKLEVSTVQLFERGWMDVEDSYRAVGWRVEYDKPGYCETYEPNYTFELARPRQRE
jgi:hypothetical protein